MADNFGNVTALIFPVIHLLLAARITALILLTKRDIGAALGWMGIVWLSPLVGSFLYLVFGINRVKRRANRLLESRPRREQPTQSAQTSCRDDHLMPLERAVNRITGRATENNNDVIVLHNGDEAYPKMLMAIDSA